MNPTPSTEIDELAKKAIEARKTLVESGLPEGSIGHSMIFADAVGTNTAYHNAATPEAWLTISARVRELEGALKPFAEIGKQIGNVGSERTFSVVGLSVEADGLNSHYTGHVKGGDLRRAAALSPPLQMKQGDKS